MQDIYDTTKISQLAMVSNKFVFKKEKNLEVKCNVTGKFLNICTNYVLPARWDMSHKSTTILIPFWE